MKAYVAEVHTTGMKVEKMRLALPGCSFY
jgi:hypothetical protein